MQPEIFINIVLVGVTGMMIGYSMTPDSTYSMPRIRGFFAFCARLFILLYDPTLTKPIV